MNIRTRVVAYACALGMAFLAAQSSASAMSAPLPPGASIPVPATTAAMEPDLNGIVLHDALLPFTIKAPTGAVLCSGQLQDRVVRSTKTGLLDFYYRIRNTRGTGAVAAFSTASFAALPLRIAYRTDGLGSIPPRAASRSAAPGALLTFRFLDPALSCAQRQESRFTLIKTTARVFRPGGMTRIYATTGASASLPTLMP